MACLNDVNRHGQKLNAQTADRGNHSFARMWVLECTHCGESYGANSCDFHIRRCPHCQDGKAGLPTGFATAVSVE